MEWQGVHSDRKAYVTGDWYESGGHYYATQDFLVYADDEGEAGDLIMRKNLSINADEIYQAGQGSAPSYSNSSVLTFDHFDDDDEVYYYTSEDLITRESAGATKTVHYN